jgi:predicted acetyltransferase
MDKSYKIHHIIIKNGNRLKEQGGHVGYAIRPSERNKGYGTTLLKLMIKEAMNFNIDRLLLTIRNDNPSSLKVAQRNNGSIERINEERHYIWINC